jgi:hypothetical protein
MKPVSMPSADSSACIYQCIQVTVLIVRGLFESAAIAVRGFMLLLRHCLFSLFLEKCMHTLVFWFPIDSCGI